MILDALVGLYERLAERGEVAAEGWCKAKVSYAVNLSEEGRITGILPMKTEADRGKKKVWVPVSLMVPEMVTRSSGVAANFLCDNSKYILGIDAEGTSPRVLECFHARLSTPTSSCRPRSGANATARTAAASGAIRSSKRRSSLRRIAAPP